MAEQHGKSRIPEILASLKPALRDLARFDRSRISATTPLQNALGVFLPLAIGAATGNIALGLGAAIGALNVAFSDRPGPYRLRAARMLAVSLLGGLSALVGGLAGPYDWLTVALVAIWGLAGGILVVFGPAAEQIGLTSLVLLIVYGGFGASPRDAVVQAGLIVLGGVLQTLISVVAWPFRRFGPEREVLAAVFRQLAAYVREPSEPGGPPPATNELNTARVTLTGLGRAQSSASVAFRVLLDEAERIRLELITLRRLQSDSTSGGDAPPGFAALWRATAELLDLLASGVSDDTTLAGAQAIMRQAEEGVQSLRAAADRPGRNRTVLIEALNHADALLGQLRACVEIVDSGDVEDVESLSTGDGDLQSVFRPGEWTSTLRANLTLQSTSFRHALRLAVTVAIATALARHLGVSRAYWVPLTVAIVLKPDFTSTFTRGVLRVLGTLMGLMLATLLFHVVGGDIALRVALIGLLVYAIRSIGPANFGLSAVAVTAVVVFLFSFVGASPESIIHHRAIDTLIGGALALAAYAVWPSWERTRTPVALADMLDAYRRYTDLVLAAYRDPRSLAHANLEDARLEARLARSNVQASIDRMRSESAASTAELDRLDSIFASSHRFIQSIMMLEASLYAPFDRETPPALGRFAADVDVTLEALDALLRQNDHAADRALGTLPDLRADHRALVTALEPSGHAERLLALETERATNSLNTMVAVARQLHPPAVREIGRDDSPNQVRGTA